jgi:hypothetical protein
VSWLGLLYSILCLSSLVQSKQSQINVPSVWSPTALNRILAYREKVVQCLVRAQFAKGGPDVMETLVHYLLLESYLNGDSNVGVWLLMGNIVQIGSPSRWSRPYLRKLLTLGQRSAWAIIETRSTSSPYPPTRAR